MGESGREVGRRAARLLKAAGLALDVRSLAAQWGVEILERGSPPPAQPALRSEYRPAPPRIILYLEAIACLANKLEPNGQPEMPGCDLVPVHIAHELFHHLEAERGLVLLGREEAEHAAHAFAQELLNLSFDPAALSR